MAAGGSNYYIKVQVDETSAQNAERRLRQISNFAATTAIGSSTHRAAAAAPILAAAGGQRAARSASIESRSVAQAVDQQTKSYRAQEQELSRAVVTNERFAGSQLHGVRAFNSVGIASSQTTRQIARGQASFRALGNEVGLVATKLALWSAAGAAIGATVAVFASMVTQIAAVNDAMIGLQRVTGETFDRRTAAEGLSATMRDLNVSATDAATAAFEMGKAYGNMNEALAASRTVLLANKVAEIDLAQASQQLVQVTNAYGLTGFQQERILDKLNKQQNTLGVNIGKTLEATARASQVNKQAGGTIDNLIARTAVGIRFTGFAPETVARSQARLAQQVLSGKGQADIIASLGVSKEGQSVLEKILLPGDPTKLKNDIDLIFNTVGESFQKFSATQKNDVATAFTGGRQGQLSVITGALLENFVTVQKQTKESANAQGSSLQELATVLSSVREQVKSIGTEFGVLAGNIERSGLLGVFAALLASLKNILVITNDIFSTLNKLPDAIRAPLAALAGFALIGATLNKIAPGTTRALFTPGNDFSSIRKRDKESESQKEASIRSASLTKAAQFESEIAKRRVVVETEIAAIRNRNAQVELAFRAKEAQLAKKGFIGQQATNKIANALNIIPSGQTAVPEVAPDKQISEKAAFARIGVETQATAAIKKSSSERIVSDTAVSSSSRRVTSGNAALSRSADAAAVNVGLLGSSAAAAAKAGTGVSRTSPQSIGGFIGSGQRVESDTSMFRKFAGFLRSPGGLLTAGIGAGAAGAAIQGKSPPGQSSVLGSGLGGLGTGLAAGFFTANPLVIGAAATTGLAAGIITAMKKRNEEVQRQLGDTTKIFSDLVELDNDALKEADEKLSITDVKPSSTGANKDLLSRMKKGREEIVKFGAFQNEFNSNIAEPSLASLISVPGTVKGFDSAGSNAENLDKDINERLNARLREIQAHEPDSITVTGAVNLEAEEARQAAVDQAVSEQTKRILSDRDKVTKVVSRIGQNQIKALTILSSEKPEDQATRFKSAGQIESSLSNIVNNFKQGDPEQAQRLLDEILNGSKKENQAVAAFIRSGVISESDVKVLVKGAEQGHFEIGRASDESQVAAFNIIEILRSFTGDIQADSKRLQNSVGAGQFVDPNASAGELDSALDDGVENFDKAITDATLAYQVGVLSISQFNLRLTAVAKDARERFKADPADTGALSQLANLDQSLQQILQDKISQIDSDVKSGFRSDKSGGRAKVNALVGFLNNPNLTKGGQAEKEGIRQLNEASAAVVEAQRQSVIDKFEPLLEGAETQGEKAALLGQRASQLSSVVSVITSSSGFTKQQILNANIAISGGILSQEAEAASIGLAFVNMAQSIFGSASRYGSVIFQTVVPDFIRSNNLVKDAVSAVNRARDFFSGIAGDAAKGLGDTVTRGTAPKDDQAAQDQFERQNRAQNREFKRQSDASEASSAAAEAKQAAEEAAQAAKDLLSARFDLLKALARGDDVKVARVGLRQAKAESGIAKTAAEKIRSRAAIINAEKDLQEQLLSGLLEDIQFKLDFGKITTGQAINDLQKQLKRKDITKDQRRNILRQIESLKNQDKNDASFGLPTEIPLPSINEIKRIIGIGRKVAQVTNQQIGGGKQGAALSARASGAGTTITNKNNITIVVSKDTDLRKVRKELDRATGQTIQRSNLNGSTPGFI